MPRPSVFLDRDGVINRRRLDHVKSWSEFEFLPGALEALRELRERDHLVVVITNQSAVGRGMLTSTELDQIHNRMCSAVAKAGGRIEAVYCCPHLPADGCACRKPAGGLLLQASAELDISLPDSVMVGDSMIDVEAARAVGCQAILATDLREAVRLITRRRLAIAAC